jgi:hypothetical protein
VTQRYIKCIIKANVRKTKIPSSIEREEEEEEYIFSLPIILTLKSTFQHKILIIKKLAKKKKHINNRVSTLVTYI